MDKPGRARSLTANRPLAVGIPEVAYCLAAGVGNRFGSGRDGQDTFGDERVAHALTAEGHDASEDGTGRGTPLVPVAFTQNQRDEVRDLGGLAGESAGQPGTHQQNYIAFSHTQGLDAQPSASARPTLRAEGGGHAIAYHENIGGNVAGADHARAKRAGASKSYQFVGEAMAVRRLTPLECCRLQAFPDDWLDDLGLSDSAKYRLLGNAVCVNVAAWIGGRLALFPAPGGRTG